MPFDQNFKHLLGVLKDKLEYYTNICKSCLKFNFLRIFSILPENKKKFPKTKNQITQSEIGGNLENI